MSKTAVFIATTEGPTRLQRLTAEAPDVRSVICLGGRAMALPISADYDTFVRRPTGVIEACYGHNAYRMDISDPIGSGLSWQLGAFVGHALAQERRLATNNETYNRIVWASGEVNCDLTVQSVSDIGRKLQRSRDLFDDLIAAGPEIVIAVPAANRTEAEAELNRITVSTPEKLKFVAAESVLEIFAALRLKRPRKRANLPIKFPSRKISSRAKKISALAGIAAILTTIIGVSSLTQNQVVAAAAPQAISAVALETHAPAGGSCAEVMFDIVAPQITEQNITGSQADKTFNLHRLCNIQYRLKNITGRDQKLWILAARDNFSGTAFRTRTLKKSHAVAAKKNLDLDARPPRRLTYALEQNHLIFVVPATDTVRIKRTTDLFERSAAAKSKTALTKLVEQARSDGISVLKIARQFHP